MDIRNTGQKLSFIAVVLTAVAVLGGIATALVNREIGSLGLMISAEATLLALFFVPPVLAEMRDRQTLSVYRAMRRGR
jgi:hypothetical protein